MREMRRLQWLSDEELRAMTEEQLGDYVYEQCQKLHKEIDSVLPPVCCLRCKGCPMKTLVAGICR